MSLTTEQQATLKAAIIADPVLDAFPNNSDGAYALAGLLSAEFAPAFTVWKTQVTLSDIGDAIDGDELESLTTAESNRMQVIASYSSGGINPSLLDRRVLFDGIFAGAGGAVTRPRLAILWRRLATYGEKIFAAGTGSDADPAELVIEGNISYQDVLAARNS